MIFSSITSKELTDDTFAATLYTLLGAALFSVCAAVLGWVLCKYLLRVSPLEDVGVYAFVFASLNSGFMGFPITLALFGQDILYFMVVHNITLTLYLYTLGPIILSVGSQGPQKKSAFDLRSVLASLLNINTIVAFVSIIMLFAGLHLPALLFESIETIGDATVPISMLLVGVQLGEEQSAQDHKERQTRRDFCPQDAPASGFDLSGSQLAADPAGGKIVHDVCGSLSGRGSSRSGRCYRRQKLTDLRRNGSLYDFLVRRDRTVIRSIPDALVRFLRPLCSAPPKQASQKITPVHST